jgi:hypothetical protein
MNEELETYIEQVSAELFTAEEWDKYKQQYDQIGLSTDLYEMRWEVLATVFERRPELFDGIQWINDDNGMPLWVRPGVTWIPDFELDDDD